jgi:hypothetical protein
VRTGEGGGTVPVVEVPEDAVQIGAPLDSGPIHLPKYAQGLKPRVSGGTMLAAGLPDACSRPLAACFFLADGVRTCWSGAGSNAGAASTQKMTNGSRVNPVSTMAVPPTTVRPRYERYVSSVMRESSSGLVGRESRIWSVDYSDEGRRASLTLTLTLPLTQTSRQAACHVSEGWRAVRCGERKRTHQWN